MGLIAAGLNAGQPMERVFLCGCPAGQCAAVADKEDFYLVLHKSSKPPKPLQIRAFQPFGRDFDICFFTAIRNRTESAIQPLLYHTQLRFSIICVQKHAS